MVTGIVWLGLEMRKDCMVEMRRRRRLRLRLRGLRSYSCVCCSQLSFASNSSSAYAGPPPHLSSSPHAPASPCLTACSLPLSNGGCWIFESFGIHSAGFWTHGWLWVIATKLQFVFDAEVSEVVVGIFLFFTGSGLSIMV